MWKFLKHLFVTEDFDINGHKWYYRVSEGEYDWAAALTASPKDRELYDPINPFTIYAYKVREPDIGVESYILEVYPRGCAESGCALYFSTEAADEEDLLNAMKLVAENVDLLYEDPEEFYERLRRYDINEEFPSELERYKDVYPTPSLARRIVNAIRREMRFVKVKHIPRY